MLRDTAADGHISSFNHLRIKVAEILTLKLINGEEINLFEQKSSRIKLTRMKFHEALIFYSKASTREYCARSR